jgi:hypothetical protein
MTPPASPSPAEKEFTQKFIAARIDPLTRARPGNRRQADSHDGQH